MSKDQTRKEWLDNAEADELGLGVLLVQPRPRRRGEKIRVWDVTYGAVATLGEMTMAFRWIPYRVRARDALAEEIISLKCGGTCRDTCVKVGCLCHDGECV